MRNPVGFSVVFPVRDGKRCMKREHLTIELIDLKIRGSGSLG